MEPATFPQVPLPDLGHRAIGHGRDASGERERGEKRERDTSRERERDAMRERERDASGEGERCVWVFGERETRAAFGGREIEMHRKRGEMQEKTSGVWECFGRKKQIWMRL